MSLFFHAQRRNSHYNQYMSRYLLLLFVLGLLAKPTFAEEPSKFDRHWFDQSQPHRVDENGRRILTDGRPDRPALKAELSRIKDVPPVLGKEVTEANAEMSDKEKKNRAKNPHLYWDYDKTVTAAGVALVAAAIGFMVAGPFGAIIGFLGGLIIGALASNFPDSNKTKALASGAATP